MRHPDTGPSGRAVTLAEAVALGTELWSTRLGLLEIMRDDQRETG
jgi:hypothetical protein